MVVCIAKWLQLMISVKECTEFPYFLKISQLQSGYQYYYSFQLGTDQTAAYMQHKINKSEKGYFRDGAPFCGGLLSMEIDDNDI